jgi:cytoskeletal protein RodZ
MSSAAWASVPVFNVQSARGETTMSEPEQSIRNSRTLVVVLLLLLVAIVVGGGFYLWYKFNPFFERSPQFQEAQALATAVRQRPLTTEEFARCLRLCESGENATEQLAIAAAEAAVTRNPEFKAQAVEVLSRIAGSSDPTAAASATSVLKRLASPPPQ